MAKISVQEFYHRVHSLRDGMGRADLAEEQRQNLKKMFVISYFDVDRDDPEYDEEKIVNVFESNMQEYLRRMVIMGMMP